MLQADRILVVDGEGSVTEALALILGDYGHVVETAHSFSEAVALLKARPFGLAFIEQRLADAGGVELLTRIKAESPETEIILMTAHGPLEVAVEATERGAFYYMEKPFTPNLALVLAARALEFKALKSENRSLRDVYAGDGYGLVGRNPKIMQIRQIIQTAAPSEASVLIEGESGTGKELVAAAFHFQSARGGRPFIRLNCAAIPQELIESEMFGYRKGAFTGADRDKRGLMEAAAGGTLLLDEIAEIPVHVQTKLLRALQDRRLRRLGDEQELPVDFRLITSTNRDTAQMIQEGALRKDLYFRVSTIKVKVPPLRERSDDVRLLAEHFLMRYAGKYGKRIRGISQPAYAVLARYDWPGNVRELEAVVEHAVLFSQEEQIMPEDLPEQLNPDAQ